MAGHQRKTSLLVPAVSAAAALVIALQVVFEDPYGRGFFEWTLIVYVCMLLAWVAICWGRLWWRNRRTTIERRPGFELIQESRAEDDERGGQEDKTG